MLVELAGQLTKKAKTSLAHVTTVRERRIKKSILSNATTNATVTTAAVPRTSASTSLTSALLTAIMNSASSMAGKNSSHTFTATADDTGMSISLKSAQTGATLDNYNVTVNITDTTAANNPKCFGVSLPTRGFQFDASSLHGAGTGTSDDYAITTAVTYDSTDFFAPSFAAAAYTMQDGVATNSSDGMVYYYYVPNGGYAPNGNILAHSDLIMGDWIFAYDAVDRLSSAIQAASMPTSTQYAGNIACWSYDAFGNRTMEAFSSAACNNNPTPQVTATYNPVNNQIVNSTLSPNTVTGAGTFIYDASGNTVYDGNNRYWYDAEGQLCAVQSQRSSGAPVIQYAGARIAKGTLAHGEGLQ